METDSLCSTATSTKNFFCRSSCLHSDYNTVEECCVPPSSCFLWHMKILHVKCMCQRVCDVAAERATFPLSFCTKALVWGSASPLNAVSWFRTTTTSLFWLHFNPHFESADFSRANSSHFFRCTLLYFWNDLRNSKFTGLLKAKDALFRQLIMLYHLLWWWLCNCSF